MKFGDVYTGATTPAYETYFQVNPLATLAQNETFYYIGQYGMSWPGHLYLDMWAEVNWPGTNTLPNGAALWLSVGSISIPAPGHAADLGINADCPGIFSHGGEPCTHAVWYNLAAGQTVTAYARIYTTAPGYAKVNYIGGFFRPYPF